MSKKRPAKRMALAAKPKPKPKTDRWLKLAAAALDGLEANVFVANPDLEIVYINDCAQRTLAKIAGEVQRAFAVDVREILGSSIHRFHKDPAGVEKILSGANTLPHHTLFAFGTTTLEARINSVRGSNGSVAGYVVAWEDVTYRQRLELDFAGQVSAIQRSQAVIDFELDGTIINANDIFLKTMGYSLDEVKGQRHSMFVDETMRNSAEYRDFWQRLNRGELSPGNSAASARMGGRSTFREFTVRSSTRPESRSRSSNLPPM